MTRKNTKNEGNNTAVVNIVPMRKKKEHKNNRKKASDPLRNSTVGNRGTASDCRGLLGTTRDDRTASMRHFSRGAMGP